MNQIEEDKGTLRNLVDELLVGRVVVYTDRNGQVNKADVVLYTFDTGHPVLVIRKLGSTGHTKILLEDVVFPIGGIDTECLQELQEDALKQVKAERSRQDIKFGLQRHEQSRWISILGEEFGEVCKASLEGKDIEYRDEMIQVAAVAVAAVESFTDTNKPAKPDTPIPPDTKWCMCTELAGVLRDCKSTCTICGGIDAYGGSKYRPADKQKEIKGEFQ